MKKIGIMVGRENTWPGAFIAEINRRNLGITAEYVKLDGTAMGATSEYELIVDRISHEIPYYRAFLKTAMISGTHVVNNPFWWSADDKFTGASVCAHLGIPHPRTIALPTHSYIEGISHAESLRNLADQIPWDAHVAAVGGFPVILKPAWGGGFKNVFKVNTIDELWNAYNQSGIECMMLQEFIAWEKYARCFCIGQNRDRVLVMKFDVSAPWPNRYFDEPDYLTAEEHALCAEYSFKICQALGYDMNTCEFAIKDGVPYAIDFTNPAPDMDYWSLKQKFFDWVVNAMADMCIEKVQAGRLDFGSPRWNTLLFGTSQPEKLAR